MDSSLAIILSLVIFTDVSALQIKETINRMSDKDRLFAAAYLKHLARAKDPAHRAKLGARLRRMNGGKKIRLETVKRLHKDLEAAGL